MIGLQDIRQKYWQLRSDLGELNFGSMLCLGGALKEFLREKITLEQAEDELKRGLELREANFLELARARIYDRPANPYLKLLRLAGCEFSDLCSHIRRHGLEGTLERLAKEGVYLTSEEFKGKKEVVRGGESFRVVPGDFIRSDPGAGFITQSSGTRSSPVRTLVSLERLKETAFEMGALFSAHNLRDYCHAVYDGILPVGGGVRYLLVYAKLGAPVDRWFARKVPVNSWLEGWYYYLSTHMIVLSGKWYEDGFPVPEFTDIPDIQRIVRWVAEKKRAKIACCIKTAASNAGRIARVAWEKGVSLEGTKFIVGGEPFTEAKRGVIERVGAKAIVRYSFSGGGTVGLGCANPLYTDEIHVGQHRLALIRQPKALAGNGSPIHPLLFTTVSPETVMFLLNAENGDYAASEKRDCGCGLERMGLTLHLHHIRSYEKFTSEGMNYFYGDLFELMEKTLPGEFGGGPGDYQLVEEEDGRTQTRLTLIVHPNVGLVDEEMLLMRLQKALSQGPSGKRFQTEVWKGAGAFRVRREAPHTTARGKILPLHIPH